MFVAPSKIKNPSLFVFISEFPIIAACPAPIPGKKLQKGEARREPKIGFFILIFGFIIFCFGIIVLFFML